MGFVLVFAGIIAIVTGANNTYAAFATQVQSDAKTFVPYAVAIGSVGALGYVDKLRTASHMFLALIIIALLLVNGKNGFFANFTKGISATPVQPTSATAAQSSVSPTASTATINGAITSNQTGPFGSTPTTPGQAKAFGWLNYFFGLSTNSAGQ